MWFLLFCERNKCIKKIPKHWFPFSHKKGLVSLILYPGIPAASFLPGKIFFHASKPRSGTTSSSKPFLTLLLSLCSLIPYIYRTEYLHLCSRHTVFCLLTCMSRLHFVIVFLIPDKIVPETDWNISVKTGDQI